MRFFQRSAFSIAMLALLCVPAAFAQAGQAAAPAPAPCKDVTVTVRLSEITPTGSPEKFKAAVAAHLKWYRDHGFKDNQIVIGQVWDQETHNWSNKKFYSFHINPPRNTPHDAAWDAYVKLYQDTSKIVEEHLLCVPETAITTDPVSFMKM